MEGWISVMQAIVVIIVTCIMCNGETDGPEADTDLHCEVADAAGRPDNQHSLAGPGLGIEAVLLERSAGDTRSRRSGIWGVMMVWCWWRRWC